PCIEYTLGPAARRPPPCWRSGDRRHGDRQEEVFGMRCRIESGPAATTARKLCRSPAGSIASSLGPADGSDFESVERTSLSAHLRGVYLPLPACELEAAILMSLVAIHKNSLRSAPLRATTRSSCTQRCRARSEWELLGPRVPVRSNTPYQARYSR